MFTQWQNATIIRALKGKGGALMARVTKDMTMGELLQTYYGTCPEIVDDLTSIGMHCIG